MQTFLPRADLEYCAEVLDWRRLGKQRVECQQLIKAITEGGGWANHPAAVMWRGYVPFLARYAQTCVDEWVRRGYRNTLDFRQHYKRRRAKIPEWWGLARLHASHRANLIRKDPVHYGKFGWIEEPATGYLWPVETPAGVLLVFKG